MNKFCSNCRTYMTIEPVTGTECVEFGQVVCHYMWNHHCSDNIVEHKHACRCGSWSTFKCVGALEEDSIDN